MNVLFCVRVLIYGIEPNMLGADRKTKNISPIKSESWRKHLSLLFLFKKTTEKKKIYKQKWGKKMNQKKRDDVWVSSEKYNQSNHSHAHTLYIKTRVVPKFRREYETFSHLDLKSDLLCSGQKATREYCFQSKGINVHKIVHQHPHDSNNRNKSGDI